MYFTTLRLLHASSAMKDRVQHLHSALSALLSDPELMRDGWQLDWLIPIPYINAANGNSDGYWVEREKEVHLHTLFDLPIRNAITNGMAPAAERLTTIEAVLFGRGQDWRLKPRELIDHLQLFTPEVVQEAADTKEQEAPAEDQAVRLLKTLQPKQLLEVLKGLHEDNKVDVNVCYGDDPDDHNGVLEITIFNIKQGA